MWYSVVKEKTFPINRKPEKCLNHATSLKLRCTGSVFSKAMMDRPSSNQISPGQRDLTVDLLRLRGSNLKETTKMRVAIPSDNQDERVEIFPFFGQAKYFFIYEIEKGKVRLLEVRENPDSDTLRGLSHSKKSPGVQQMIDDYLNDCGVFVAVNMNENIVSNLVAKSKKVIFVEGEKVRELATRIAKRGA